MWQDIKVKVSWTFDVSIQRGDIISVERHKKEDCSLYDYEILENKTANKIKRESVNEILKEFNETQKVGIIRISKMQHKSK